MRPHGIKQPDTFLDDPPPWATVMFSERQREALTFTKLWCRAVAGSAVSRAAKHVALTLALYFSGNEEDSADPSVARLADETSMHRSTVIAKLDELEDVGLIERERSRGRVRTTYWLRVPDRLPGHGQPSDTATVATGDGSGPDEQPTVGLAEPTVGLGGPTVGYGAPTVVPSDPKGLEGFSEGMKEGGGTDMPPWEDPSSSQEDERQDQGRRYANHVRDGVLTVDQVFEVAGTIADSRDRELFLAGFKDAMKAAA